MNSTLTSRLLGGSVLVAAFSFSPQVADAAAPPSPSPVPMFGEPCVKEGETNIVTFTTDLTGAGTPTNAEVIPKSGRGMEKDFWSPDDKLGKAPEVTDLTSGSTTFQVPIENKGGSLSGPNGKSQNGGSEGNCIEVYVKFKVRYPVTICRGTAVEFYGVGGSTSECWEVWGYTWLHWRKNAKKVCPC
jgi:hypothetical protein